MTTEHASVPREELEELVSHFRKRAKQWADFGKYTGEAEATQCADDLQAILSRATSSDVVPEHIGHPRSPGETRDEIEMFLRDAYAAGCNAALRNSLVVAMEYARREAPKLRAILEPSATRVVTDEDVERAMRSSGDAIGGDYAGMRAALQADRQRGVGVVPSERFYDPLPSDADEYDRGHVDGWNACRQSLLAQRGQVREGSNECPTCGGPCDMFEEEGTFEIAYIYRSTSK